MADVVVVGKRLVPREHIAFVEPYDPAAHPAIQTTRAFRARLVMLNRDSVLIEETTQDFARANGFRMLVTDDVATNPDVRFRVELFQPAPEFSPSKPYASRLLWRDLDGNDQSKLLLSDPETVVSIVVAGEAGTAVRAKRTAATRRRRQPTAKRADTPHL